MRTWAQLAASLGRNASVPSVHWVHSGKQWFMSAAPLVVWEIPSEGNGFIKHFFPLGCEDGRELPSLGFSFCRYFTLLSSVIPIFQVYWRKEIRVCICLRHFYLFTENLRKPGDYSFARYADAFSKRTHHGGSLSLSFLHQLSLSVLPAHHDHSLLLPPRL